MYNETKDEIDHEKTHYKPNKYLMLLNSINLSNFLKFK